MLDDAYEVLKASRELPSPSAIGFEILRITQSADYDQDQLARTIMSDPALSGRILLLANAAARDGGERVETVPRAAMRLGSDSVRSLALGFSLVAQNRDGRCSAFSYDGFWSSSLATAVAAHELATRLRTYGPVEAFTCGLLCEIGRLALACAHGELYSDLIAANPDARDAELACLERAALHLDHAELGARMMTDWGLPPSYAEAVRQSVRRDGPSEDPGSPGNRLARILRASKTLGRLISSLPEPADETWRARLLATDEVARALPLEPGDLRTLGDTIAESWRDWGRQLAIPTCRGWSMVELYERIDPSRGSRPSDPQRPSRAPVARPEGRPQGELEDGTRVLLVDEDERILRLLHHTLAREGFEVHQTTSGSDGLRLALELCPHIAVLDWMMPGMNGVQMCELLNRSSDSRKIYKIIMMTRDDEDQVVQAFDAGADEFVVKPFNPRILLARVRAGERMVRMRESIERSERARMKQIAELGLLSRRLRAAALTDSLTGLPNRRSAMGRLKLEWEGAVRSSSPLSVTMIDIDHFKLVNDEHGHDVGDEVLRRTAALMRQEMRASDLLCRIGGEEFLAIHVATDLEDAVRSAERLREVVERRSMEFGSLDRPVTVCLGVAVRTDDMATFEDLLKRADQHLYEAKAAGRNRVAYRQEPPSRQLSA